MLREVKRVEAAVHRCRAIVGALVQVRVAEDDLAPGCRPPQGAFNPGGVDIDRAGRAGDHPALESPIHQMVIATIEYRDMRLPGTLPTVAAGFEIVAIGAPKVRVAPEEPGARTGIERRVSRHLARVSVVDVKTA